jgi:hypothetical protein
MSITLFDTCVFWSCVTRCGCRTTSSTLFTVYNYTDQKVLLEEVKMADRGRGKQDAPPTPPPPHPPPTGATN